MLPTLKLADVGTQAIGLAQKGYNVTASDLSRNAIARAKVEAELRSVEIEFSVCDMLNAAKHHNTSFDLLISCDNSIPHLLGDDEILSGLRQMFDCVRVGGGCLVTMRNYDESESEKGDFFPYGSRTSEGKQYEVFQTREFDGDDYYNVSMHFVEQADPPIDHVGHSRYYVVSPNRVMELMRNAGFVDVQRFDEAFYQPVLTGTRPG